MEAGLVASKPIHPVQEQHMEEGVQVQGRAEALDQGDGTGRAPEDMVKPAC